MRPDYKVKVTKSLDDPEWDAFVSCTAGGHHVQTSRWARVKSSLGWKAVRISMTDSGQVVGGAQILVRKIPLLGSAGYVSKGPLCNDQDPELAETVLREIIEAGGRNRCRLMAVQPPDNGDYLCGLLESLHFRESRLELAPTASLVIDLEPGPDKIIEQMKRETRHHIRRSERAGIVIREGGLTDLETFYTLYLKTARRQGFLPFRRDYFDMLWRTFSPPGWIALLIACYENEPVSAQLLIPFGKTVTAKMVGWSGEHSRFRPNDALFWASIVWACRQGYRYFDFEGLDPMGARVMLAGQKIPDKPGLSQDIIKYGYGGKVALYPPVYEHLPSRAFNWIYHRLSRYAGGLPIPYRLTEYVRKR
jgi:lipid II:glycine glycyltransferase (peptidoglycan interpeptide bridge formation enzyme)